jgi:hypothetical protein
MQTMQNNTTYFMCRFTLGKILIENAGWNFLVNRYNKPLFLRDCMDPMCKGAHNLDNIKTHYTNSNFNSTSKAKYEWIQLYLALSKSLETAKLFTSQLNIIEMLQLWKSNSLTLPEEFQEFAIAFERITHMCPDQLKVNNAIRNRTPIEINCLCLGTGINCRDGVNKTSELLCVSDFLTGTCDCINKKDYNTELTKLKSQLETLKSDAKPNQNIITKKMQEINDYQRMIHYTDNGMIPFDTQYKQYLEMKEVESRKNMSHIDMLDHMIRMTQLKKPIMTLGKLGKK